MRLDIYKINIIVKEMGYLLYEIKSYFYSSFNKFSLQIGF